ncbi:MFS transporter, partial [Mycobacterium tuberculosis]|nr:MFS transporter [Mycobacterium tuberculosis]
MAFGFFMQSLDTTIVNTALPSMAKSLGESPLHMHMIIVSYVLTVAVMLPASGWLADRVGICRVHLSCAVVFSLSLLALPLMLGSRIQLMAICLLLGAAAGALYT